MNMTLEMALASPLDPLAWMALADAEEEAGRDGSRYREVARLVEGPAFLDVFVLSGKLARWFLRDMGCRLHHEPPVPVRAAVEVDMSATGDFWDCHDWRPVSRFTRGEAPAKTFDRIILHRELDGSFTALVHPCDMPRFCAR